MSLFRVCEFWLGKSPNKWVFRATRGKSLRVDPSTPAAFVRDEQTLSKRKFLAAQWSSSTLDGGNTTSYVAAALTLTLSLDREKDLKCTPRRNQKNHKLFRMSE
jgi:hypothetical protein